MLHFIDEAAFGRPVPRFCSACAHAGKERSSQHRQAASVGCDVRQQLAASLGDWPIRRIERDMRLSGPQRVALYELAIVSLKDRRHARVVGREPADPSQITGG
jgi:hypothetical protein